MSGEKHLALPAVGDISKVIPLVEYCCAWHYQQHGKMVEVFRLISSSGDNSKEISTYGVSDEGGNVLEPTLIMVD